MSSEKHTATEVSRLQNKERLDIQLNAPPEPTLTCEAIDTLIENASSILEGLEMLDGDSELTQQMEHMLYDIEDGLEELRTANKELRASAAYWRKIALERI